MYSLDGNAIAAALFDVYGREMTTAVGTCGGCGWSGALAEVAVYLVEPGVVARCPHCDMLLIVIVERRGMACIELAGFASLQEPAFTGFRITSLARIDPTQQRRSS
jgi:hypothetical protein